MTELSNDFKKIMEDGHGIIEGAIKISVADIINDKVLLQISITDGQDIHLVNFDTMSVLVGGSMTLTGVRVSTDITITEKLIQ